MTIDLTLDGEWLPDSSSARAEATPRVSFQSTLLDIFDATVAAWGERPAIEAPDAVLTYTELTATAEALAGRLRSHGVGPGDRVGVRVPSGGSHLYVAILGALKAGAAYVPVDADDPAARARQIFEEAKVCAVVGAGLRVSWEAPAGGRDGRPGPDDDAWVIFTSGSTGRPKGVAVTHRAAAAFVDAEAGLWQVMPQDRVLAGLSVAFDASCEEMWLAWGNGAALIPAPRRLVRSGAELGPWLAERRVTVISTVPTLAAMWDDAALAGVRLLILGGEACPDQLAWRLAADREVWNTYGPTEATVVSTAARLRPDEPVTIGYPLRGWDTIVVDEQDHPVTRGEPGELVIGGVGLGRYLDPDLDGQRYAALPALGWERAYRTGDIVRETPAGLVYVGRRDHQVKIGGRRIELGEIDAQLAAAPGVRAACTVVRETATGNKLLVGYVSGDADPEDIRAAVAERLPAGLVPLIVCLPELPVATSGKIDRKGLPWPPPAPPQSATRPPDGRPLSGVEQWLAERWREQLGPVGVDVDSDFFTLGGSSLAAAKLVSVLRRRYPAVAVADVYEHRALGALANRLQRIGAGDRATASQTAPRPLRRLGLMQLAGVLVLFALQSIPWTLGTLAYGDLVSIGTPHVAWAWLILAWLVLASPPAHTALQVACNRVLQRGIRPGRYSRYSWLACRLWFLDRLTEVTRYQRLGGTPWADRYARLAGADVGAEARLATVPPAGALLHIGAAATVEANVDLRGWWIDGQELVIGEIWIGDGARIGSRSLLNPGCVIGDGAEIEPGSVVSGEIPAGERWGGAPACRLGAAGEDWPAEAPVTPRRPGQTWGWLFAASLAVEGLLALAVFAPAVLAVIALGGALPTGHTAVVMIALEATVITVVTVPLTAVVLALNLRLAWRLVSPGWHADYEAVGWALWYGEELKTSAGTLLFPLYASLFTRPWFRLMGLDVGRRAEISVSTGLNPLVSFGDLSQCTDDIGFCGARSRGGWLSLEPIRVGNRSFLGPGAIVRGGTRISDDALVGVMTLAPRDPAPGTSWLGVPALELPRARDCGDPARTTDPPRRLVLARGAMDLLRLVGPTTIALIIEIMEILTLARLAARLGVAVAAVLAPLVLLAGGIVATAVTVAVKWLVMGRYRRSEHPLWCHFVWRDELMNAAQEQLADELLLRFAIGTPLMSLYLRAMGSRVGRGVWCETTAVTEYDMIELGDGVAVNREACLMTHLFHDRLLRIGPTRLEAGATLGPTGVVLPDTVVGAGTVVCGHSVVMRGEELPPGTRWHGTPVVAV